MQPLVEYETSREVALSRVQRDQLRRLAPSIAIAPSIGVDGAYDLTPSSHVGVVRLEGGLELVIRPKMAIARVMFLISYAVGLGRWREEPAGLADADSILEAIVPAFTYRLRTALERGVLQDYRSEDEASTTVRGRWRIGDQIRMRYGIAPPVEVTFDDYTEDMEPNRLLRAAIHRLARLRLRNAASRWPLNALDARLAGVRLIEYDPRRVPEVAFDRRNEHYRSAVGLARLILSNLAFDLASGTTPASAFLIDMNRVVEDFVVVALRDALHVSDRVLVPGAAGKRLFLDVDERVPLKPDISLWAGAACRFVGDVKYKRVVDAAYPNADLYQLTAYAVATGLPSSLLVYAAGEGIDRIHEVKHIGKRLIATRLDLGLPPAGILEQVAEVAARISGSSVP